MDSQLRHSATSDIARCWHPPKVYGLVASYQYTGAAHLVVSGILVSPEQECSGQRLWDFCCVGRLLLLFLCKFHPAFILHGVGCLTGHADSSDFSEERQTNTSASNSLTGYEYVIVGKWRHNIPSLVYSH